MDKLKTVNIKGKDYVEVNERIKYFRKNYPGYSLMSEIVLIENKVCIIKAKIKDSNDRVIATGIAYEKEDSSFINKTSYIENCETSAWGRALGNFGIGIDSSVASYEEVANAVKNQDPLKKEEKEKYIDYKLVKDIIDSGNTSKVQIWNIIQEDYSDCIFPDNAKNAIKDYLETGELKKNLFFDRP